MPIPQRTAGWARPCPRTGGAPGRQQKSSRGTVTALKRGWSGQTKTAQAVAGHRQLRTDAEVAGYASVFGSGAAECTILGCGRGAGTAFARAALTVVGLAKMSDATVSGATRMRSALHRGHGPSRSWFTPRRRHLGQRSLRRRQGDRSPLGPTE